MTKPGHLIVRSCLGLVAALLTGLLASVALAQQEDASDIDAADEFARANRLASAGAITRSIPHYEKVLQADPVKYRQAHYNLAEAYRFKERCPEAVILYHAYLALEQREEDIEDAREGLAECTSGQETGSLGVDVAPQAGAEIRVGEFIVARDQSLEAIEVLTGEYTIEVSATDHVTDSRTVSIEADQSEELSFELDKKLFFGTLSIQVDQDGASVKVEPRELDSDRADDDTLALDSPIEEPQKLATGRYFIEVTKPGYRRWIRNVRVNRDEQSSVDVRLQQELPEAIRPR
jgi:tetratricopeptide (TPR) repeat protein